MVLEGSSLLQVKYQPCPTPAERSSAEGVPVMLRQRSVIPVPLQIKVSVNNCLDRSLGGWFGCGFFEPFLMKGLKKTHISFKQIFSSQNPGEH